jgi:hypothetical protein
MWNHWVYDVPLPFPVWHFIHIYSGISDILSVHFVYEIYKYLIQRIAKHTYIYHTEKLNYDVAMEAET